MNDVDCHTCPAVYQKARGCNEPLVRPAMIEGFEVWGCPRKSLQGVVRSYLELYYFFCKGFLPCEGGVGKQPMKILQVFKIIEDLVSKLKKKESEEDG